MLPAAAPPYRTRIRAARPPAATLLAAALLAAALLAAAAPGSAEAQYLSRDDATAIFLGSLSPSDPDFSTTAAFLYNRIMPDSLLVPGDVVADYDSTFIRTITTESYFFWVDFRVRDFWMHRAGFFFMDAATGAIDTLESDSWPVLNGASLHRFEEEGDFSPELVFGGGYPIWTGPAPGIRPGLETESVTLTYRAPAAQPTGGGTRGLIIGGRNTKTGPTEMRDAPAIHGDVQRAKKLMTMIPKGPSLHPDSIVTVGEGDNDNTGATVTQICQVIDTQIPKNLDKLHVYLIGHGKPGYFLVAGTGGSRTARLYYDKLACKLIETGAKEVCITIMACWSGSAIRHLAREQKDGVRLKGVVVTSSTDDKTTFRQDDGSAFMKWLLSCAQDIQGGDADKDGKFHNYEGVAWARAINDSVEVKKPQGGVLGGREAVPITFPPPIDGFSRVSRIGGGTVTKNGQTFVPPLEYEIDRVHYQIGQGTSGDSLYSRTYLYVRNNLPCSVSPTDSVTIIFLNKKNEEVERLTFWPWMPPSRRSCVRPISDEAVKFKLEKAGKVQRGPEGVMELASKEFEGNITIGVPHHGRYRRGEFILLEDMAVGAAGDSFSASVDPVPGWGLSADPASFFIPDLCDSNLVLVRGTMPPGAAAGGFIDLTMIDHTAAESTAVEFHAMLYDSLPGPVVDGMTFLHQSLDTEFGMALPAGSAALDHSVLNVVATGSVSSTGGVLMGTNSAIYMPPGTATPVSFVSTGMDLVGFNVVHALNGIEVEDSDGFFLDVSSVRSQGDGITLRGDVSGLFARFLTVEFSADDGLVLDGVSGIPVLGDISIRGSGDMDVVVTGGTLMELRNARFDAGKVTVEPGSGLGRSWDTGFTVLGGNDLPIPGAVIIIVDALGDTVAVDTTNAVGTTEDAHALGEWVNLGGAVTFHTPHTVHVSFGGADTSIVYVADEQRGAVLPIDAIASGIDPTDSPTVFRLAQSVPNPMTGSAVIRYTLTRPGPAELNVFDLRGRRIARLASGRHEPGDHAAHWEAGPGVASGVYFYQLRSAEGVETRKLLLIR